MSTKHSKVENKCTGEPLYIELSLDAKNCRTLLHMHTRTCMYGSFYDLLAPLPPQHSWKYYGNPHNVAVQWTKCCAPLICSI